MPIRRFIADNSKSNYYIYIYIFVLYDRQNFKWNEITNFNDFSIKLLIYEYVTNKRIGGVTMKDIAMFNN